MTTANLGEVATALNVHPRTILRALSGDPNVKWSPGDDPEVDLVDVALAFGIELDLLDAVMAGKERLLKAQEMREVLGLIGDCRDGVMSPGSFYHHGFEPAAKTAGITRYAEGRIREQYLARQARSQRGT